MFNQFKRRTLTNQSNRNMDSLVQVNWEEIDARIDSGLPPDTRGLPPPLMRRIATQARALQNRAPDLQPLRAAELAISWTYQKKRYRPGAQSYLFPERQIVEIM